MKTNRIKTKTSVIETREAAESVMTEIANIANNRRVANAMMDEQILSIKEKIGPALDFYDEQIKSRAAALEDWAVAHPDEFPKGRKTIEFLSGILGFRSGMPKLALLSRAWNWDKAAEAVAAFLPNFIRHKPEVDKEALIAQRAEPDIQMTLPKCGLKVIQDEGFFVEPKLTDPDTPC